MFEHRGFRLGSAAGRPPLLLGYLLSAGYTLLAALVVVWLSPWSTRLPFLFFFVPVVLSARYGGLGPGVLATVLSAILADYFALRPLNQFSLQPSNLIELTLFAVVALFIVFLTEDLRRSQRKNTIILESIADAFCSVDQEGHLTYINEHAARLPGKPPEQLLGKKIDELFPGDDVAELYAQLHRALNEQVRLHFENYFPSSDQWLEFNVYPSEAGLSVFFRDISERKRAQQSLQESEERFRRAHQAANIGDYVWDFATNQVTWAAEVPALHDIAPDGRFETWMKHVHVEDLPRVFEAIDLMKDGGEHFSEARVIRPDRSVVWIYSGGRYLFDADGNPTHAVGIAMDITERKLAEERLRSTEKLAAAGRLSATIAHEINNPLEAITNLHFLLQSDDSLSDSARQYLVMAEQEVERIAHIAKQTLGFYRGTATPAPVSLPELLDDVVLLYKRKIRGKEIQVQTQYNTDLEVKGLKGELLQVFSNLLTNAIDALDNHGSLKIAVNAATHGEQQGVQIDISDNGAGIRPEHLNRIFEAFFTTKKDVGTGLGLWVTKGIIENHHGTIEARSDPQRRETCFSVFLPRRYRQ